MTAFNAHHIKSFNQKVKHLVGEGKVVMSHKELRDLNHEIMELLLHLNSMEADMIDMKNQVDKGGEITIELDGKPFK
jgi:predicted  nucleic acid-binding Zn-ribbon protein